MNSFGSVYKENGYSRNFGGSSVATADPYVTGRFHIWFANLPSALSQITHVSDTEIKKLFSSLCLSITPPGKTVNRLTMNGLGGTKWSTRGSIENATSLTLKFKELKNEPILNLIDLWVYLMRSDLNGLAYLNGLKDYGASLLYWTFDAAGNIQHTIGFDGIFPLKSPMDLYSSSIETIDKLEPEIEFNVNRIIRSDHIINLCLKKHEEFLLDEAAYEKSVKRLFPLPMSKWERLKIKADIKKNKKEPDGVILGTIKETIHNFQTSKQARIDYQVAVLESLKNKNNSNETISGTLVKNLTPKFEALLKSYSDLVTFM